MVFRPAAGLQADFLLCVEEAFDRIRKAPLGYAVVYRDVRQTLVRRFPYVISYLAEEDRVVVIAVMYGGRDPDLWKARIPN